MYKVAEVQFGKLETILNRIEADGGTVTQVLDGSGSRKDYVIIIWQTRPAKK